ncbi:VOC family protein [Planktotalea sp.]|uniref:VOC family protein n=1 Tax=Planktotalea sp. TaxID=2029877 RepID=UPI003F6D7AE2
MLKFMTLFAADMGATCEVYRAIGLTFVKEKHGNGPVHYAHESQGLVLEIYQRAGVQNDGLMLGFDVTDLALTKSNLQKTAAKLVKDISAIEAGKRMIFSDPDGLQIYIQQID